MSPQPSSYEEPRISALLQASNDSARLFRTVYVTFMTLASYILVVALSVDDELLFTDGELRAPILNVGIRTSNYFATAPWIILLLHVNVLIQGLFLARKVNDYRTALPLHQGIHRRAEMLRLPFPIPLTQVAGDRSSSAVPLWLLKLVTFSTLVILPVVTLSAIQVQFLAFQSPANHPNAPGSVLL